MDVGIGLVLGEQVADFLQAVAEIVPLQVLLGKSLRLGELRVLGSLDSVEGGGLVVAGLGAVGASRVGLLELVHALDDVGVGVGEILVPLAEG